MRNNTHTDLSLSTLLHSKIFEEIQERYGVESQLASEMAWDFLEILACTDASFEALDKYILH